MLIEFSVGNYLSFKDTVTFSMVASNIKQHSDTHTFEMLDYKLLKSAVIYGANASGKSNLIKAMFFAKNYIIKSSTDTQIKQEIPVESFLLNTETENEPSLFEFVFIKDNIKYRYGFRVNKTQVIDEWLFQAKKLKETKLFERNGQDIIIYKGFNEGKLLESKTRPNALFLSVVAQFNGKISEALLDWFDRFNVTSGLYGYIYLKMFENNDFKNQFLDILKFLDLSINNINMESEIIEPGMGIEYIPDIHIQQIDFNKYTESGKDYKLIEIKTTHKKFDKNNKFVGEVEFYLDKNESEGTKKIFSILGPVLEALNKGEILVVDELDIKQHPLITQFIIKLFDSNKHNPLNAQLIFNTHDTNLLNKENFRRDQIWFTEKDKFGATDLYSLVEYEFPNGKVRHDRTYAKDYLAGKYGAIPFIGDFDFSCNDEEAL